MGSASRVAAWWMACLVGGVCLVASGDVPLPVRVSDAMVPPPASCGVQIREFDFGGDISIPDDSTLYARLHVTGLPTWIWDVDLVTSIAHIHPGDLVVKLISPDGTTVILSKQKGSAMANAFNGTIWDDQAGTPLTDYADWTSGVRVPTVAPQQALSNFQGRNPNGEWTLQISDEIAGTVGTLADALLRITACPQPPRAETHTASTAVFATAIPNPGTLSRALDVSIPGPAIIHSVSLLANVEHDYTSDLTLILVSPSGTEVTVTSKNGGGGDDLFAGTRWTDTADPVTLVPGFISGTTYSPLGPEEPLAAFNGESANGTWTLHVSDALDRGPLTPDSGSLVEFRLEIRTGTCNYVAHTLETFGNHLPETATALTMVSGVAGIGIGSILPTDDVDYWSFPASAGARVWAIVDTGGDQHDDATSRDSTLRLIAPDGTTVVEADADDGIGTGGDTTVESTAASAIAGRVLNEAGTHYLRVHAPAAGVIDPYRIYAIVSPVEPYAIDAPGVIHPAISGLIPSGTAFGFLRSSITAGNPDDVFTITNAPAGALLVISVDTNPTRHAGSILDLQLRLDNETDFSDGELLAVDSSTSGQTASESFVYRVPATDTYYVKVQAGGGSTGSYQIMGALLATPAADLRLSGISAPAVPVAGDERTSTFTVSNGGPSAAGSVALTYVLSPLESFVSVTAPSGWTCPTPGAAATTGTCTRPTWSAGSTANLVLTTRVRSDAGGADLQWGGRIAAASPPASWFDLNPRNDVLAEHLTPAASADLAVSVSGPTSMPVGDEVAYSILGKAGGPSNATSPRVTIALPASTVFIALAPGGMTCSTPAIGASGAIVCTAPVASASSSTTLAVTVAPAHTEPGAVVAVDVTVSSDTPDPLAGNNHAVASTVMTRVTAADADGDGLPDAFEAEFGLDPTRPGGDDGPTGDPDGDGAGNLQELRDGTHPRGFFRQFFAEGSTGDFFDERLALFNVDSARPGIVQVRYLTSAAEPVSRVHALSALTRQTIDLDTMVPGLTPGAVSVVVESDAAIVADRLMRWNAAGHGSHGETGVPSPSTTWYLAEGSTLGAFNLYYLLQNPSATDAVVTVTYLLPSPAAPIVRTYPLPANSRQNIWVNLEGPEFVHTDVSAAITATVPIIVERAMYLDEHGHMYGAGHDSMGVTAPALSWFLAEGATGTWFDLFILLANPGFEDAVVEARYLKPDGSTVTRTYTVRAQSRYTVWVDLEGPELASTAVSTTVTSTNGVPIIVERAMWWPNAYEQWYEAHNSAGATQTGTLWAVAAAEVNGPYADATYLLIANTSDVPAEVRVTSHGGGPAGEITVTLAPHSRTNVVFEDQAHPAATATFGVLVESVGAVPAQIVVETALYRSVNGIYWAAGTNSLAARLR